MMLTISLPPEVENQVLRNASERGQDTEQYLYQLIDMALRQPVPPIIPAKASPTEFLAWWQKWSSAPAAPGPYPDTAFRREDIYDDEGR